MGPPVKIVCDAWYEYMQKQELNEDHPVCHTEIHNRSQTAKSIILTCTSTASRMMKLSCFYHHKPPRLRHDFPMQ